MVANPTRKSGVCVVCGSRLKRNGKTSSGATRWRCTGCGSSSVRKRPDLARASQLREFVAWLLGSATQRELDGGSGRSFRDQHSWCWRVAPLIPDTGEAFNEIQIDGTYLGNPKRCFLVAITASMKVIKWRWAKTESTDAWSGLLAQIPPPRVVVTDGGTGIASALAKCWPDTRIQRCLVHVQRDVLRRLTQNPRTEAAKSLRALAVELTSLRTQDSARAWEVKLHDWHQVYADFLNEKTTAGEGVVRPVWAGKNSIWWFTHKPVRAAYFAMETPLQRGHLFTYLEPEFASLGINSTTNRIEGAINRMIKEALNRHRGMPLNHQQRAAEWWCYMHSANPKPIESLIRDRHWQPTATLRDDEDLGGPAAYDTAIATTSSMPDLALEDGEAATIDNDGIGIRKGWAGRSK